MSADVAEADHLRVEGVSIVYAGSGRHPGSTLAVDGAELTVRRGEFVVIVGPSGCGKTTLLNAVAGFIPVAGGRLMLDGTPITGPSPQRAMVFQEASLLPWRTVLGNISYGLDLARTMPAADRKRRARELLELVGLGEFGARYPAQLSGGQQQRVNLARALAVEPALLLLDEPFASIDAQTREQMQTELLRICAARDVTALFVTHDITEAAYLADRVAVFGPRPGSIVREVTVPFERPRDASCRRDPRFQAVVDEIAGALSQPAAENTSRTSLYGATGARR
jgi:NitT/TauT family transport system ATP-binding protein